MSRRTTALSRRRQPNHCCPTAEVKLWNDLGSSCTRTEAAKRHWSLPLPVMPGSDKHRCVVRRGGFQWPRVVWKWSRSEQKDGPAKEVKIPLHYVGRDSAGPLGEGVLLNGWFGDEVPLYCKKLIRRLANKVVQRKDAGNDRIMFRNGFCVLTVSPGRIQGQDAKINDG